MSATLGTERVKTSRPIEDTSSQLSSRREQFGGTTIKRRLKEKAGPGPGSYSIDTSPIKKSSTSVKFGHSARKEHFVSRDSMVVPGPGGYIKDNSTLSKRSAKIGLPYKHKVNSNPGPGEYTSETAVKRSTSTFNFGTEKRKEIWGDQEKRAQAMPGAGSYI